MDRYEELKERLSRFNEERDWDQFHSPGNLAKSIAIEAGELLECFQWDDNYKLEEVEDEMADVFAYLINLSDKLGVDLFEITAKKIDKNEKKYPVEKAKGKSDKYDRL